MRVALLHNSSAGSEDHTDAELIELIHAAGHEVVHTAGELGSLTVALQRERCELVVLAGGDGTVGRAACELSDWDVPLAILPLGTANNTALTLGLHARRIEQLIQRWGSAERVPFDIALADDGFVQRRFSEGVGWGVFPRTVAAAKARGSKGGAGRRLSRDRALFQTWVDATEARRYEIEVDARDYSGNYVMVQVMNVPFIGPRLKVSPTSDPGDGWLELVLADEAERAALRELAGDGELDAGALRCIRGKHIRVRADDGLLHHDGELVRRAAGVRELTLTVHARAVRYLR